MPPRLPSPPKDASPSDAEILINVSPCEVRAALLERQQVVELHVDRPPSGPAVGDFYLGRVRKLGADGTFAFVDLGEPRDAFLKWMGSDTPQRAAPPGVAPDRRLVVEVTRAPSGSKGARVRVPKSLPAALQATLPQGPASAGPPRRLHRGDDPIGRLVAGWPIAGSRRVVIDDDASLPSLERHLANRNSTGTRVDLHSGDTPLFVEYGVEAAIERALARTVFLDGGGSLAFDRTEALTVIDVNSSRASGARSSAATPLAVNLEAVPAIARHLRLRNLSGLIVVDFVSMPTAAERESVSQQLRQAVTGDRARIQIGAMSEFGLIEMTRQHLGPSLADLLTEPCATCAGSGLSLSTAAAAAYLLRRLEWEARRNPRALRLEVEAATPITAYLASQREEERLAIERRYGVSIQVTAKDGDARPKIVTVLRGDAPRP